MSYVSSKKAQIYYNVSHETLRTWSDKGTIKSQKTPGGY